MEKKKLTGKELLYKLQREYFCAELRSIIYKREANSNFQKNLMIQKKAKILALSKNIGEDNIFYNPILFTAIRESVIQLRKPPIFIYKEDDKEFVKEFYPKDMMGYYAVGSKVCVKNKSKGERGKEFEGVILTLNFKLKLVEVEGVNGEFGIFDLKQVYRLDIK